MVEFHSRSQRQIALNQSDAPLVQRTRCLCHMGKVVCERDRWLLCVPTRSEGQFGLVKVEGRGWKSANVAGMVVMQVGQHNVSRAFWIYSDLMQHIYRIANEGAP